MARNSHGRLRRTKLETERVVTHRTIASVSRLMGYTPQGIKDLLETCAVKKARLLILEGTPHLTEWVLIGIARRRTNQPIERVSARFNFASKKFEFSSGPESHALTANAAEQQRIREEIAEEAVKRINERTGVVNPTFIKRHLDRQASPTGETIKDDKGSEQAQEKIIFPVAPRDPRGLNGRERGLSAPRNGKSGPHS